MQNINLSGIILFNDAGMPDLPGESKLIAVPEGAKPILKILDYRTEIIEEVEMAPAPVIPFDTEPDIEYEKNMKVFSKNAFYPENPFKLSEVTEIRGVDAVMLGITPFQYNPVTKQLIVYKDIKLEVTFEGGSGYFGENRLRNRVWEPILDDALLNYSSLPKIDFDAKTKNAKDDEYEYVILTLDDTDFTDWAETIAEFRRKQGISTGVFTISDGPGENTVSSIETWVDNMYNTWTTPPAAILILADYGTGTSGITSQSYDHPYSGSDIYITDNKYADVDGDDLPDIAFARITANNASQLEVMITKFINYESNPPTNIDFYNHPVSALGWQDDRWFQICSEVIGGFWNNQLGKETVRINELGYLANNYNTGPWSTATNTTDVMSYFGPDGLGYIPATPQELGGFTGGNATMVNNAINSGSFMLQHRDHGGNTGWGEPDYDNSDIDGLNNTDLSFIMSINCLTGHFNISSEVFAEKFHRYTSSGNNSGALGIIAASEVSYSFVNDVYVWGCYDNMWPNFMPGETANPESRFIYPAFANIAGKNFLFQSSWPYNTSDKQITYRLFHHHGDPYLNLYSEVPADLTVSCDDIILYGNNNFDVDVDENAFIAITYYNETEGEVEILGTAESSGGTTTVNLSNVPSPGEQVLLTVTKQNYFRYTKLIDIITPSGPYVIKNSYLIDDSNENNNGEADYCETFNIDITLENVGTETAENVTASLTITDPYVISVSNNENISFGNIEAGSTAVSSGSYTVAVADSLPDQYKLNFDLVINDDSKATYESGLSITVNAPVLQLTFDGISDEPGLTFLSSPVLNIIEETLYEYNIEVSEMGGNGNGMLDPGEIAEVTVLAGNTGHADFYAAQCVLISLSQYVTVLSDTVNLGTIGVDAQISAPFTIEIDEACPIGESVELKFKIISDNYTDGIYREILIVNLKVGLIIEDFETGDFNAYDWTHSGNADWTVQTSDVYEGTYSAKSGNISHSQSTSLQITLDVLNSDEISFFSKVSSEGSWDFLKFYINGVQKGSWSGSGAWGEHTYSVSAGSNIFKWTYSKDGSVSYYDDCGYLDYIIFPAFSTESTKGDIVITAPILPGWLTIQDYGDGTALLSGTAPTGPVSDDVRVKAEKDGDVRTQNFIISVDEYVSVIDNELSINIYPNPVKDILYIDLQSLSGIADIKIQNINGQVIYESKSNNVILKVDITNYAKGVYFVNIVSGNETYNAKVIFK